MVVATGAQLADCAGLAVADVGIAAPVPPPPPFSRRGRTHSGCCGTHTRFVVRVSQGSVEGVQQAADAIMTGGALDSILDAVEFVRKKGEGGSCTLQ